MVLNIAYQCCFCGLEIISVGADVGGLYYTANVDNENKEQHSQQLWCHGTCLRDRVHSSVPLFAYELAQENDDE